MNIENSIELTKDIEYIKNILFKYEQGKNKDSIVTTDFQTRCNFVIEQFKNMFEDNI